MRQSTLIASDDESPLLDLRPPRQTLNIEEKQKLSQLCPAWMAATVVVLTTFIIAGGVTYSIILSGGFGQRFGNGFLTTSKSDNHFDFYVYAVVWPSASCKKMNQTHHGHCALVPKEVNTWTVHGLWPSQAHSGKHHAPFNCDPSWKFDYKNIKPILGDLHKYWPNLMDNTPADSFWEHEWSKHGTCACQNDLCTQRGYFEKAMKIRADLGVDSLLAKMNVKPDKEKSYSMTDIQKAFAQYPGAIKYQCDHPPHEKFQAISQLEICLDKQSYKPVKCSKYESNENSSGSSGCKADVPVKLYPIHMKI